MATTKLSSALLVGLLSMHIISNPVAMGAKVALRRCLDTGPDVLEYGAESSRLRDRADGADTGVLQELDDTQAQSNTRRFTPTQPFGKELIIHWGSWETTQMITAVAAVILSEKLGFDVRLESGITARELFPRMTKGEVHLSFENWPESNRESFKQYVTWNGTINAFQYQRAFGRSGIFETCSRTQATTESTYVTCADGLDTKPLLR